MSRHGRFWFGVVKLAIWTAAILLFFRFLGYLIGGHFRDLWLIIAAASTAFIVTLADVLKRFRLPGDSNTQNALVAVEKGTTMPENADSGNKILHINHGESYHNNAPGGMMNFAPVTVIQHLGTPQADPEPAQPEPQNQKPEPAVDTDTIDILGLMDFSARLRMPGVSRNTIDNILQKANIKPCSTEKDGRAIRYLYPRKESKAAVSDYLADKNI